MSKTFLVIDRNMSTLEIPADDYEFQLILTRLFREVEQHPNRNQLNKAINAFLETNEDN